MLLASTHFRVAGELFWLFIPHAVLVCKARRLAVFNDLLFLHRKLPQRDVFPVLFSLLSLFSSSLTNSLAVGDLSIVWYRRENLCLPSCLCQILVNESWLSEQCGKALPCSPFFVALLVPARLISSGLLSVEFVEQTFQCLHLFRIHSLHFGNYSVLAKLPSILRKSL